MSQHEQPKPRKKISRRAKVYATALIAATGLATVELTSGDDAGTRPQKPTADPSALVINNPNCIVEANNLILKDWGKKPDKSSTSPDKLAKYHPQLTKLLDKYCTAEIKDSAFRQQEPITDPGVIEAADIANAELNVAYADVLEQANTDYQLKVDPEAINRLRHPAPETGE